MLFSANKVAAEEVPYVVGTAGTEDCEGCLQTQFKHLPPQLALRLSPVRLRKGHVKIILLPIIAFSYPFFCSKLGQTLHKQQEQHS